MRILDIQTFSVLGLRDATYDFSHSRASSGEAEAHDVVLITGGPGAGKTRLLELIIAAREAFVSTDGSVDHTRWVRPENRSARAVASWLLSEEERETIGAEKRIHQTEVVFGDEESTFGADPALVYLFELYDHTDETPKLEYFAENRRLDIGGGELGTDPDVQLRFRMGKSSRKYAWIPNFLSRLEKSSPTARRFAETLERLSPSCTYDAAVGSRLRSSGRAVGALSELSSSEADALLFAATAAMVGLSRSVVAVDRPELYSSMVGGPSLFKEGAHPAGEPNRLLEGLLSLGKDNQLILATSQPELAAGRPHAVIHLSRDEASLAT